MGSVKLETRNEGRGLREWDYVPLSEPRIVAQQIKNRWKVDQSFYPLQEETSNPLISNGVFPFSEPVLVTYMDLDIQMGEARLTKSETAITQYLMRGYTIPDIAEHYGTEEGHVRRLLKRASEKIADAQKQKWMQSCGIFKEGEEFLI